MHHEEIVTIVDDCHSDLILRPQSSSQGAKKKDRGHRRSLSSSGLSSSLSIRNWTPSERRQNSFETVINVSDDNIFVNDVSEPKPISDGRLTKSNCTISKANDDKGDIFNQKQSAKMLEQKRHHPLSHSQETVLYTDDGYDPQPILPNRQPGTPDVWVPIMPSSPQMRPQRRFIRA